MLKRMRILEEQVCDERVPVCLPACLPLAWQHHSATARWPPAASTFDPALPCRLQGARFAGKSIRDLRSLGSDGWFFPRAAAEKASLREIIYDGFLHHKEAK
jgi:hypothetical protein